MKCVYGLINLINKKIYIGSTNNFSRRKREHLWMLSNNKHKNQFLQNAVNKTGLTNFRFIILENIKDDRNIYEVEQIYLDKYKSYNKKIGYNLCKFSNSIDNTKLKKKVYQYNLDGNFINVYNSLAEAAKELNCNYSTISLAAKGKNKTACGFLWSFNEETKESIKNKIEKLKYNFNSDTYIKTNKTKIERNQYKSVEQYDLKGNLINSFITIKEASEITGIGKDAIYGFCNGKYKKGKSGYIWKYKN